MNQVSQKHRSMAVKTGLKNDALVLSSGRFKESLGETFVFELTLLSEKDDLPLNDILGQTVSVRYECQDGNTRYFNGIATQCRYLDNTFEGLSRYECSVRPWFWLLTLRENCRIFTDKTFPQIIEAVFAALSIAKYTLDLTQQYKSNDYVVQFNESDFDFVSRIFQQEGMFYYFRHSDDGNHTMVIADDNSALPEGAEIEYYPPENLDQVVGQQVISNWRQTRHVKTGAVTLTDYDFESPHKALLSKRKDPKIKTLADLERFQYPGTYTDLTTGDLYTRLAMEAENADFNVHEAEATIEALTVGTIYPVINHLRDEHNASYLLTATDIELVNTRYLSNQTDVETQPLRCLFNAIPAEIPFRNKVTINKPYVQGPQSAVVVGPETEEIHTDKYGRVKVAFHWDRYSEGQDNNACWIRVVQSSAGKHWGNIHLPRVGQEVLVNFLDGDIDKPIVTGAIYNGDTMPPWSLPSHKTRSGTKTRSSKGGQGFNEFYFDDTKDEEQIFLHGQKDLDIRIKHDERKWVGHQSHRQVLHSQYQTIHLDSHDIIKGDAFQYIQGEHHVIHDLDYLRETTRDEHWTIGGDRKTHIKGSEHAQVKKDYALQVNHQLGINVGQTTDLKTGKTINLEAGTTINIKAGGSFISIGPQGITMSGSVIKINSGGNADSASPKAPDKPARPEKSQSAVEADKADIPGMAKSPRPKKPPEARLMVPPEIPSEYSPAATVMKEAAVSGTPFTEPCEEDVGSDNS